MMTSPTVMPTVLKTSQFDSTLCNKIQQQRKNEQFIDCIIRVITDDEKTTIFKAHRLVLASGSKYFKDVFENEEKSAISKLELRLNNLTVICFEALLEYFYTGSLDMSNCTPNEMLQVAKLYQTTEAEELLQPYCREVLQTTNVSAPFPALFSSALLSSQATTLEGLLRSTAAAAADNSSSFLNSLGFRAQLQQFTAQEMPEPILFAAAKAYGIQSILNSSVQSLVADSTTLSRSPTPKRKRKSSKNSDENEELLRLRRDSTASTEDGTTDTSNNMGNIIVPSSDREGWCRNKKYIKQVENGYMCAVCKKVYGRYNSVSYHVTIYHRNPPIKCYEEGCPFKTREARYIHFHKFYRHHIPLPDNIDLRSRKCPICTHVSKSPAMLEKHISRHLSESSKNDTVLQCSQCDKEAMSNKELLEHMATHQNNTEISIASFPCKQCNYRGQSEKSLRQHLIFKHSADTFKRKISCEICQYVCAAESKMQSHYRERHPEHKQKSEEDADDLINEDGLHENDTIPSTSISIVVG